MKAIPILELSNEQRDSWLTGWNASGALRSPFLHPAYCAAVARSGRDVVVAIDDSEQVFFPVQRQGRKGVAPGDRLADITGAIQSGDNRLDARAALDACGLNKWSVRNSYGLMSGGDNTLPTFPSPFVDLSAGVDGWFADLRRQGHSSYKSVQRKARKITAEIGPLKLVTHDADHGRLQQLLEWKDAQRRASGTVNVFRSPWAQSLAADLLTASDDDFEGSLDCLYAGDTLVAAHLGLRTDKRIHWWVPAYSVRFERYSPGLILLLELAKSVEEGGIDRIDLGPGDERYKYSMSNAKIDLSHSSAHRYRWEEQADQMAMRLKQGLRGTFVESQLKGARTLIRRSAVRG